MSHSLDLPDQIIGLGIHPLSHTVYSICCTFHLEPGLVTIKGGIFSYRHIRMTSLSPFSDSGGFLNSTIPSPPASTTTSTTTVLPHARSQPLKAGGPKESNLIHFIDKKLLSISRRYEKRAGNNLSKFGLDGIVSDGYTSFADVAMDLEGVADIIWVSGTRKDVISSAGADQVGRLSC
jgi:hypothetical protein